MGIRETLNQNPAITTGATAAIILVALGIIVWQLAGGGSSGGGSVYEAFYTTDDGKTWFADDVKNLPPFQKDGKTAYQVFVWTCDGGKTKFVSHLQRYTQQAKQKLEEARTKGPQADPGVMEMVMMSGVEVKAPGAPENAWFKQDTPQGAKITEPKCPGGQKMEDLEPVVP